jgi:hypothetical protein
MKGNSNMPNDVMMQCSLCRQDAREFDDRPVPGRS